MSIQRRDFMKLFGVSLASLYLSRCAPRVVQTISVTEEITCYEAPADIFATEPNGVPPRARLRLYWLRFEELAQASREDPESDLREELTNGHFAELDDRVANGEISVPVAELVQEAYEAAVYHVWRSNVPITCYDMAFSYAPTSAAVLVEQTEVLNQIAEAGTVNPDTLAKARAALEHDLAFYALNEADVQSLYEQLSREAGAYPSFEELSLELTPEAQEATQFIVDLLTGK